MIKTSLTLKGLRPVDSSASHTTKATLGVKAAVNVSNMYCLKHPESGDLRMASLCSTAMGRPMYCLSPREWRSESPISSLQHRHVANVTIATHCKWPHEERRRASCSNAALSRQPGAEDRLADSRSKLKRCHDELTRVLGMGHESVARLAESPKTDF